MSSEIRLVREPALDEIREPKHGWQEVRVFWKDSRMHVLLDEQGGRFFAVTFARWGVSGDRPVHRAGPFDSQEEAWAAARRWFIDNPAGSTAEMLARHPYDPVIRELLLALNEGDLLAGRALEDRLSDSGAGKHLFPEVKNQLFYLGIWPRPSEEAASS
jgi:hypothetical protein